MNKADESPAICLACADALRCRLIGWVFVDEMGETCPVVVPAKGTSDA